MPLPIPHRYHLNLTLCKYNTLKRNKSQLFFIIYEKISCIDNKINTTKDLKLIFLKSYFMQDLQPLFTKTPYQAH